MKKKVHKVTPAPKSTTIKKKPKPIKKTVVQPVAQPDVQANDDLSTLGRQPIEFFVERYGADHFRVIDNIGFVFSNGRWVSVDVDGFSYVEREICAGDPQFVPV